MPKPRLYPSIPGESSEDRSKRLAKEAKQRRIASGHIPIPRAHGKYVYPVIEGESKQDRKRRIADEARARIPLEKRWRTKHPEIIKDGLLKKLYGISLEQLGRLTEQQSGVCKICGFKDEGRPLHVDHDHNTGKVRGLLCDRCNMGLGQFKDSIKLLKIAQEYLEFSFDPEKDFICV